MMAPLTHLLTIVLTALSAAPKRRVKKADPKTGAMERKKISFFSVTETVVLYVFLVL